MLARALAVAVVVAGGARAFADGFELVEQSPAGAATAGAQTADAYGAAAAYYNPAALTFQRGLTVMGGAAVLVAQGVETPASGPALGRSGTLATATVFAGQRVSARYAVGIGVFDPYAWREVDAAGSFDLRAVDVAPTVAFRPFPWLGFGFGIDVLPTTLVATGGVPLALSGTGLGGDAGVLLRAVPRWLDLAVRYRSAADVDLSGHGVATTLHLPHALAFGAATHPLPSLTLTADLRLTLWESVNTLVFGASSGTAPPPVALGWQDSLGVRAGAAWGLLPDEHDEPRLTVRVGAGWEQAPTQPATTFPPLAEGDRALVAGGVGARLGAFGVDVGYEAAIERPFDGAYGTMFARYHRAVTHTVVAALTIRLPDFPARLAEPDFKR